MAVSFVDTSAILKRYVAEAGSAWIRETLDPASGVDVFILSLTPVEFVSAITRRVRGGSLRTTDAVVAIDTFPSQTASQYQVIPVSDEIVQRAIGFARKHGLRGYDAVQLAAATQLHSLLVSLGQAPLTLVSSDLELNAAAATEGLMVEDPNNHI